MKVLPASALHRRPGREGDVPLPAYNVCLALKAWVLRCTDSAHRNACLAGSVLGVSRETECSPSTGMISRARIGAPHQSFPRKVDIQPPFLWSFTDFSDVFSHETNVTHSGGGCSRRGVSQKIFSRPTSSTPCAGSHSGVCAKLDELGPIPLPTNQCTGTRSPPSDPHSLPRALMGLTARGEAEWTARWAHQTRTRR